MAKQALYEMKYPKQMIQEIVQLIALHDDYIKADEIYLRRLLAKLDMNYETAFSLIRIQYADACAKILFMPKTSFRSYDRLKNCFIR